MKLMKKDFLFQFFFYCRTILNFTQNSSYLFYSEIIFKLHCRHFKAGLPISTIYFRNIKGHPNLLKQTFVACVARRDTSLLRTQEAPCLSEPQRSVFWLSDGATLSEVHFHLEPGDAVVVLQKWVMGY